ncbi:MAG TPA: GNAT family N-acetyltransferase [Anaerolineaceae bacterium]|nr:GNAT family N-acetyltransferase [Anaerolineaceae bacterium]
MSMLTFRTLQDEGDYPLLLAINHNSRQADHDPVLITLEDIAHALAHMDGLTPTEGVVIAALAASPAVAIGYSRLGWYSSRADNGLYYQISFLRQDYRTADHASPYWSEMVAENERRLRHFAAGHPAVPQRYFQAWASDQQTAWMAVLENAGYQVVRRFNNMLYQLNDVPNIPLPAGFDIRPVEPQHLHYIWEAQREMNAGLFENVAEDWLEEKYPAWLEDAAPKRHLWQVAWVGDQLAGMVLTRIDAQENESRQRKRGYTEHVYVRPPWRGLGLASALIAHSLAALKAQGMAEAELGVDAENESAAFTLYQRLGYRTFSVDTWYRKAM